jgi:hypothetical protein
VYSAQTKVCFNIFGRSRNPAPKTQGVKIKLNTVILWLDRRIQFFLWIARSRGCVTIIAEGGMKGHIYMIEFCMEKKGDNHGI